MKKHSGEWEETSKENGKNIYMNTRVKVLYGLKAEIANERKTRKRKLIRKSERKLFCSCKGLARLEITRDLRHFANRRCDYLCDRYCNIIFCVVF